MKNKYQVGIDEVGRGPIAGPVAVAVVGYDKKIENEILKELAGIKDSKKLSEKKREKYFQKIKELKNRKEWSGKFFAGVIFVSANDIDKIGINPAIQKAIDIGLENFCKKLYPKNSLEIVEILLDGGLKASAKFDNQKSIIRGDEQEFIIATASVLAKVVRDQKMKEYGVKFPQFLFEKHKGYGTKEHFALIKKHSLTKIHRRSFLKKFLN